MWSQIEKRVKSRKSAQHENMSVFTNKLQFTFPLLAQMSAVVLCRVARTFPPLNYTKLYFLLLKYTKRTQNDFVIPSSFSGHWIPSSSDLVGKGNQR